MALKHLKLGKAYVLPSNLQENRKQTCLLLSQKTGLFTGRSDTT